MLEMKLTLTRHLEKANWHLTDNSSSNKGQSTPAHGGISPAIYLGKKVFVSLDSFESSLLPLAIPMKLTTSPAMISAAVFVHTSRLLLAINGQVFLYFYKKWKSWKKALGINNPVTELSNYDCCYAPEDPVCSKISYVVLAYDTGSLASKSQIFYSEDGGYMFKSLLSRPHTDGKLLGVYNFASSSEIGMLLNSIEANSTTAYFFTYGNVKYMKNETSTPFQLDVNAKEKILSLQPPGLRGFIVFSSRNIFLSSSNNGLTSAKINVLRTDSYRNTSLPEHEHGVCFVAATSTEVAVLTIKQLFYGSLEMASNQMVHLGKRNNTETPVSCQVLMFEDTGKLSVIHPVSGNGSVYFHFQKCTIDVQSRLMSLRPPLEPCPVEILSGNFHNNMYYIDMKQVLYFNVTFVPKPGTGAQPYVTVSNPHVLAFQAQLVEDGHTYDGNTKYNLQIKLIEQQFSGMAHRDFQNNSRYGKLSSITVDIYNKGIFCIDMHPLTALIAADCPPKKHIKIVKTTNACSRGLFEQSLLLNFTYSVDRNVYDPMFQVDANCISRAQNWTTLLNAPEAKPDSAWTRYNYESCKVPRGNDSLPSASAKYQVLNKNERNRIVFSQYNGIYVFKVIVVDTLYSYCELTTIFSVYVHGFGTKSHEESTCPQERQK
uniref:Cation channel sperm-associated auxiliary subunit delta n=1 Tax=Varanus komodoensis TaxID=61221 RepID=A0A8D2J1W7_VARKO